MHRIVVASLFTNALVALVINVVPAHSQTRDLAPEVAAKAKDLKQADATYLKALCDGSKKEREEAKSARNGAQEKLGVAIIDDAVLAPEVQKLLATATAAGDAAGKTAANANASEQEKADAQAKFTQAKGALGDAGVKEIKRMQGQVEKEFGLTLAAREECPEEPKKADEEQKAKPRVVRNRNEGERVVRRAAPAENPPPAAGPGIRIGIGIPGVGITLGR
jgi:hypothetical protein